MMMFGYGGHWSFWEIVLMWTAMAAIMSSVIWIVFVTLVGATRRNDRDQANVSETSKPSSIKLKLEDKP